MARSKYKRYSRGGRFRQQGDGLRAAVDEIRLQRQTEIDALKQQALNQQEVSKMQISGLSNVARNESDNRQILNNLENKIYQTKRDAIAKKGQREVENILGQAKELGNEAEFWESFATKHSKKYGELAGQLTNFAQYRAAVNAYQNMSQEEKDGFLEPYEASYTEVVNEAGQVSYQIEDISERKELRRRTVGWFANNHHLHAMLAEDYVNTIKERVNFVRLNSKTSDGNELYNKDTASQLLLNAAYQYMYQNGIPFASKAGQQILQITNRQITAETHAFTLAHEYKIDKEQLDSYLALLPGYFKNSTNSEDDLNIFHDHINLIHESLKDMIVQGTDGNLVAAGDPIRASYTPKDNWALTLGYLVETLEFSSVEEAIQVLNLPVRDPNNGEVILNKDGLPAEYLLDKHQGLLDLVKERIVEKQEDATSLAAYDANQRFKEATSSFFTEYEESVKTGDFTNTILNKDWRTNLFKVMISDPGFKNHPEAEKIWQILAYNPSDFPGTDGYDRGNFNQINNLMDAFYAGDTNEALTIFAQMGFVPDRYTSLHESLVAASEMTDFKGDMDLFIEAVFMEYIPPTILGGQQVLPYDLIEMSRIGSSRFMNIWANNSDITDINKRWEATKTQFREEVVTGVTEGTGWAGAVENVGVGADPDRDGGYVWHALSGATSTVDTGNADLSRDTVASWFSTDVDTGDDLTTTTNLFDGFEGISTPWTADLNFDLVPEGLRIMPEGFEGYPNPFATDITQVDRVEETYVFEEGDPIQQRNTKIKNIIDTNLKSLINNQDVRNLLIKTLNGQITHDDIPSNVRTLIEETKRLYPEVSTKTIMDMLYVSIFENGNNIWTGTEDGKTVPGTIGTQFENLTYPADLASFVEQKCGTAAGNDIDNVALCIYTDAKLNGIDLNVLFGNKILNRLGAE